MEKGYDPFNTTERGGLNWEAIFVDVPSLTLTGGGEAKDSQFMLSITDLVITL